MEKVKTRSAKKITDTVKKIVGVKGGSAKKSTAEKKSLGRRSLSQEEIARRIQEKAHDLFAQRGYTHGNDQDDWYRAEQIVRSEIFQN